MEIVDNMLQELAVIITVAGIQLAFCWNFHRAYINTYKEFHEVVEENVNNRLNSFRRELVNWWAELSEQIMGDCEPEKAANGEYVIKSSLEHIFFDNKSEKKVKDLFDLMVKAEEPKALYKEARDAARTTYKYFLLSGLLTLLGIIPLILENFQFDLVFFFAFFVPLTVAMFSYDTYDNAEKKLVELRDEDENKCP